MEQTSLLFVSLNQKKTRYQHGNSLQPQILKQNNGGVIAYNNLCS